MEAVERNVIVNVNKPDLTQPDLIINNTGFNLDY